jgi:tryptophan synthase beta chain
MDMVGYDKFLSGKLTEYSLPDQTLEESLGVIKPHPKPHTKQSGKW